LGVSPMLAPTVGGYITAAFGWQVIFLVLAAIASFVLLSVVFFLPESYQPDPTYSLKPIPIITSFWSVMKHPQFYTYAVCGAIGFSGLFASLVWAPLTAASQKRKSRNPSPASAPNCNRSFKPSTTTIIVSRLARSTSIC